MWRRTLLFFSHNFSHSSYHRAIFTEPRLELIYNFSIHQHSQQTWDNGTDLDRERLGTVSVSAFWTTSKTPLSTKWSLADETAGSRDKFSSPATSATHAIHCAGAFTTDNDTSKGSTRVTLTTRLVEVAVVRKRVNIPTKRLWHAFHHHQDEVQRFISEPALEAKFGRGGEHWRPCFQ